MESINGINGVIISPLRRIPDERGAIYHFLRRDDPEFVRFGEVYFSLVHPQAVKAWHNHSKMTLCYAVPFGKIKLVLYDSRADSRTMGNLTEIFLGQDNYSRVTIPPGIWNGFKGLGEHTSIVANCATCPHDPEEISRKSPDSTDIPYNWEIKHG